MYVKKLLICLLLLASGCTPDASITAVTSRGALLHLPDFEFSKGDTVEVWITGAAGDLPETLRASALAQIPRVTEYSPFGLSCTSEAQMLVCRSGPGNLALPGIDGDPYRGLLIEVPAGLRLAAGPPASTDVAAVCTARSRTSPRDCQTRAVERDWQCHGLTGARSLFALPCAREIVLPIVDVMVHKAPKFRRGAILPAPEELGDLVRVSAGPVSPGAPNLATLYLSPSSFSERDDGSVVDLPGCVEAATAYGWSGNLSPDDVVATAESRPVTFASGFGLATFTRHYEHYAVRMDSSTCLGGWRGDDYPSAGLWYWGNVSGGTWSDFAGGAGSPQPGFRTAPDLWPKYSCGQTWEISRQAGSPGRCSPLVSPCDCPAESCRPFGQETADEPHHWLCN